MIYNVYIARPSNWGQFSRVFEPVADMVCGALRANGHEATQSRFLSTNRDVRTIVLAPRQFGMLYFPSDSIVYDFEQHDDRLHYLYRIGYMDCMKNYTSWTYSRVNTEWLTDHGFQARVQVLVPPSVKVPPMEDKIYDVSMFVGALTHRRAGIVDEIHKVISPYRVTVVTNKWGAQFDEHARKSKVILCLSNFDNLNIFPIARIMPLLHQGCIVVSEPFTDLDPEYEALNEVIATSPIDSLGHTILSLLENEDLRKLTYNKIQPTLDSLVPTDFYLDDFVDCDEVTLVRSAHERVSASLSNLQGYSADTIDLSSVKGARTFYSDTGSELILYPMNVMHSRWKPNSKLYVLGALTSEMALFSSEVIQVDVVPDKVDFSLICRHNSIVPKSKYVLSTLDSIEGYIKVLSSRLLHLYKL